MANNQPETQILIQTPPTYSQINSYSKIVKPAPVKYETLIVYDSIQKAILIYEFNRILNNRNIKMFNFLGILSCHVQNI